MNCHIRALAARLLRLIAVSILMITVWLPAKLAWASIQTVEEAPNQVVYQSQKTLYDSDNQPWQAIAFKRVGLESVGNLKLQLVAFPGSVTLVHPQPLAIRLPSGKVAMADDLTGEISEKSATTANIGQYNLQPVIDQLPDRFQVVLAVPTVDGAEVTLGASLIVTREWKELAQQVQSE